MPILFQVLDKQKKLRHQFHTSEKAEDGLVLGFPGKLQNVEAGHYRKEYRIVENMEADNLVSYLILCITGVHFLIICVLISM